jgi:FkbM family methyltransferase
MMFSLTKFSRKIYKLSQSLEKPILLKLRQNGGVRSLYENLDHPWFHDLNIATVLDIGANIGQSTVTFNLLLPKAHIYAFEPIPNCFTQLSKKFENIDLVNTINLGLGDQTGKLNFQCNEHSLSSSFLKMTDLHKKAFPNTELYESIEVNIERLDDFMHSFSLNKPAMAKIDVQGFEDKVIAGGKETLSKCTIIIIETSFFKLYENQPLFSSIYQQITSLGFEFKGIIDSLQDPLTGQVLQSDALFFNSHG